MQRLILGLFIASLVLLGGCASQHHHGATKTVRVLDAEHSDRKIVIINTRPAAARRCWKHRKHWHCHRI